MADIESLARRIGQLENDSGIHKLAKQRDDRMLKDLAEAVGKLTDCIGYERTDEYGRPVGTGVVGRIMRMEISIRSQSGAARSWLRYAAGAASGFGLGVMLLGGFLVWIVGPRLEALLR